MVAPPRSLSGYLPLVISAEGAAPIIPVVEELFRRLRDHDSIGHYFLWPVLRFAIQQHETVNTGAFFERSAKSFQAAMSMKFYMEEHYGAPLGYRELERITGLSKSHLCAIFHRFVGCPPMEYLRDLRLSHAKKLLIARRDKSIAEIAYHVGFASPNYFARSFRKCYGLSPTEYLLAAVPSLGCGVGRRTVSPQSGSR